ncbi:MAG: von Willebrand factor type A domain-containing protein [bacterium]|nr:von Willebrand factor type A domain-containing protein [bacterium]
MFTRKALPYLFLFIVLLGLTLALRAGSTGQIKGTITDKTTGDPIVSASVAVVGTTMGALTDFDGKFLIRTLPPGSYTLKVSHLEYNVVEIDSITITADQALELKLLLEKRTTDLSKTIKITAEPDIIEKFGVSSQVTISKEEIKPRPVATVDEMLNQVAGVVTGTAGKPNVKGGRAGDVAYVVDGKKKTASVMGAPTCVIPPRQDRTAYSPAHGGNAIVNGEAYDAMFFENYGVNPFVDTEDDHLSTFAIDVDDASYIMTRSYLESGNLPPKDAVRVEEFINHFDYNYKAPHNKPFDLSFEGSPSYFGQNSYLLRIGIKGQEIDPRDRKPANLTFVVDVSGSMGREDRLGLVRKALRMLVDQLKSDDKVGIVVYGSTAYEVLQPTSIKDRNRIYQAIDMLVPNGATYAEQGIKLGYAMANRMFDPRKINRVILCSDGVANVGQTGAEAILKEIKRYAGKGITLSSIGFGMGNYNDILLEKLGNKGNGYYAYVDDIHEAKRIFVDNLTGNLQVIARDVKIQVDFDPSVVRSYRLLGYENRDVADKDFRNDTVDGGEIGAGHSVTALYEIKVHHGFPKRAIGYVNIRYKKPDYVPVYRDDDDPRENERRFESDEWHPVESLFEVAEERFMLSPQAINSSFERTSSEFQLAACAAELAEILRNSYWAKRSDLNDLVRVARRATSELESTKTDQFLYLLSQARELKQELAER